jgi:hypothetical protein
MTSKLERLDSGMQLELGYINMGDDDDVCVRFTFVEYTSGVILPCSCDCGLIIAYMFNDVRSKTIYAPDDIENGESGNVSA